MSDIDSANLQHIRDMLDALFDPQGFYVGFLAGLVLGGGFLVVHFLRNVWSDRDE